MRLVARSSTIRLSRALKTSIVCTKLVHPGRINAVVYCSLCSTTFQLMVFFVPYADQDKEKQDPLCMTFSADEPMVGSSHHAFSWKCTPTPQSYLKFSNKVICFSVPLNITRGLTWETPSVNKVS